MNQNKTERDMADEQVHDPLNFMRSMWGNMGFSLPGMVTPTLDVDELEKRIKDMKAVEGWLRMNLSMLQMTIQGLEMQHTTLTAVQRMGQMMKDSVPTPEAAPAEAASAEASGQEAAMWPWQMMQQMREHLQQSAEAVAQEMTDQAEEKKPASRRKK
jgi:hypothetical protein